YTAYTSNSVAWKVSQFTGWVDAFSNAIYGRAALIPGVAADAINPALVPELDAIEQFQTDWALRSGVETGSFVFALGHLEGRSSTCALCPRNDNPLVGSPGFSDPGETAGPGAAPGGAGQALPFDGHNLVVLPATSAADFFGHGTIAAWVQMLPGTGDRTLYLRRGPWAGDGMLSLTLSTQDSAGKLWRQRLIVEALDGRRVPYES